MLSRDDSFEETKKLGAYARQRKVASQKIEKRYQKRPIVITGPLALGFWTGPWERVSS